VAFFHKLAVIYSLASFTSCSVGDAHHFNAQAYSKAKVLRFAIISMYFSSETLHLKKLTSPFRSLNLVFQITSAILYSSIAVATAVQFLELLHLDEDVLQSFLVFNAVEYAPSV
jgi:hypothetical protein